MTEKITNELMYETLKGLQTDMSEVRRDVRAIKDEITSLRMIMGEFIKTDARRESDLASLASRVERIERRLDIVG